MVSKLTFKGEKPKKRKKQSSGDQKSKKVKTQEVDQQKEEKDSQIPTDGRSWVFAEDVKDINGPVLIASVSGINKQNYFVCFFWFSSMLF